MDWGRWRRSAIRTGSACGATGRWFSTAGTPALPLDSFFALNPAMPNLHRLYRAGHATIVHAAATPYRERSHFDGQDVLESGLARPGTNDTGWLNRALHSLASGGRVDPGAGRALAVGPVTPLVVRGPAPVMSWAPQQLLPATADTQSRLLELYRHTDPRLAVALEGRLRLAALERADGTGTDAPAPRSCRRPASPACAPTSRRPPARPRATSPAPTARASAPWASWAGIRTSTRALPPVSSPACSARSTEHWLRSRPTWVTPGARRWWRWLPSSGARRASTVPTGRTTAPAASPSSSAAR